MESNEIKEFNWETLVFNKIDQSRSHYYYSTTRYAIDPESPLYTMFGINPETCILVFNVYNNSSHSRYNFNNPPTGMVDFQCFSRKQFRNHDSLKIAKVNVKFTKPVMVDFDFLYGQSYYSSEPNCLLTFRVHERMVYMYTRIDALELSGKLQILNSTKYSVYGQEFDLVPLLKKFKVNSYNYKDEPYCGDLNYLNTLTSYFVDKKHLGFCLTALLQINDNFLEFKPKGAAKIHDKLKQFFIDSLDVAPFAMCLYKTLICNSGKSVKNVKVSSVINDMLGDIASKDELIDKLQAILSDYETTHLSNPDEYRYRSYDFETFMTEMPGYTEKRKNVLKSKATGAFNKLMQDMDFLSIDSEKYPITYEAITSGKLTLSTFFRQKEGYFTFNSIWGLWEEMLLKYPEITVELADTVKGRTTYEKDLMSYFYFILYALPEYLERQTGKKWTCMPRLVNSSSELEPPKEDGDRGVRKTRSALTPIVDNEKNTVVVPYASLAMHGGRGTTYCYSLNYNVLQKGLSINGDVCMSDVETALNGKDDYGLMFYTLTGSAQGRGYPTFLIIFERLKKGTRVHFHRTHPMRSKDGDYNPISQWTRGCFKWMTGNVPFEKIKITQGDLAFIEIDKDAKFNNGDVTTVDEYDSHCFASPVEFVTSNSKDNVLGYMRVKESTILNHPEHENRIIPAGSYELRQARSWEASPKGVWSLRID